MPHLPVLSSKKLIKVLEKLGYRQIRQRGSHIRLLCERKEPLSVPDTKTLGRGLLRKIMRDAEISPSDLERLLKN